MAAFQASSEGLGQADKALSQLLGNDWRLSIRQKVSVDDRDTVSKLDNLIAYDSAVSAWNLGSRLVSSGTVEEIKSQIFGICYWLAFFGAAGNDLSAKLAAKIGMSLDQLRKGVASHKPGKTETEAVETAAANETAVATTAATATAAAVAPTPTPTAAVTAEATKPVEAKPVESKPAVVDVAKPAESKPATADVAKPAESKPAEDKPWAYENFKRLIAYYDATISRTSARCVRLGGISLNEYPYYEYILDVMKEIIDTAKELEKIPNIQNLIAGDFPGGIAGFTKLVDGLRTDFMTNAPPEMAEKEVNLENVKSNLGGMVADVPEGRIGPAADGFLTTEDLIGAQPQPGGPAPNPDALEKGL